MLQILQKILKVCANVAEIVKNVVELLKSRKGEPTQCKEVAKALKCGGAFDNVAIVAETLKMLQILQYL